MKKLSKTGEIAWLLSIIFSALGVCLSSKGGFGVSIVVAPAYVLHKKLSVFFEWFTFGISEYFLQGMLLLILCIVMKKVKIKYALTVITILLYGAVLDFWYIVFGQGICSLLSQRIIFAAAGFIITAFSIALALRTYLPQESYEMFVKEISDKFGYNMNKVKWIYDFCSLALAIVIMLVSFGTFSFEMIGIYTLVCVFINSPVIALFGRLLDKISDFSPAFPSLYEKLK